MRLKKNHDFTDNLLILPIAANTLRSDFTYTFIQYFEWWAG
jgi:hypothetical protein